MREKLGGVIWRLGLFVVVCLLGTFALLTIFAQLRFQKETTYRADFTNVSGLQAGDFVRIAGVEVGKVKNITLNDQRLAVVEFTADDSVVLTEGSEAAVRYDNPIGGRFLELREGAGQPCSGSRAGQVIPAGPHRAGAGPRRAYRRVPPAVPCARPRAGEHAHRRS